MSEVSTDSLAVLDRPVWHALTGHQAGLARGDEAARRLDPRYGPFAATTDLTAESLAALPPLAEGQEIWLVEREPVPEVPGMAVVKRADCLQMVGSAIRPPTQELDWRDLGDGDAAEMLALATLTAPGPFAAMTHKLGRFIGLRENGRLVAMAGERMRPGNFTEVSGVCTHPDYRGRGYAGSLMCVVGARILERGERPFLHSYAENAAAIALYESLGFRGRQILTATVLAPV